MSQARPKYKLHFRPVLTQLNGRHNAFHSYGKYASLGTCCVARPERDMAPIIGAPSETNVAALHVHG